MTSASLRLGVDVGGTRLKFAAVREGRVLDRLVVDAGARSAEALVEALARGVMELRGRSSDDLASVGLGVAGVLSSDGQTVLQSPNLPWIDGFALPAALGARLGGLVVVADNDANCVGWGEAIAGAGRGHARQICLALGTGLGGAVVLDGRLVRGGRGRGTELGHLVVDPLGPACGCGGRGCVEQYASQTGLLRAMRLAGLASPEDAPAPTVRRLIDRARQGASAETEIVRRAADALGQVIARLHRLLDLDAVVIAGGLAGAWDVMRPGVDDALDAAGLPSRPALCVGELDVDAGTIGAASLVDAPRTARRRPSRS